MLEPQPSLRNTFIVLQEKVNWVDVKLALGLACKDDELDKVVEH